VHIVTEPSQLPLGFLEPSQDKQVAVGFDCEGVSLSREGRLTLIQVRSRFFNSSGCGYRQYCSQASLISIFAKLLRNRATSHVCGRVAAKTVLNAKFIVASIPAITEHHRFLVTHCAFPKFSDDLSC
jgi:hypothetical protein